MYSNVISLGHVLFYFLSFFYVYRYVTRLDVIVRFMLSFKIIVSNRCDQEFLFTISISTLHCYVICESRDSLDAALLADLV